MSDDWATPKEVYAELDKEFHFDDDPCPLHFGGSVFGNGLSREWGKVVFLNPPYSKPAPWVKRAYEESQRGKTVVSLLKGDTSTSWFHDYVLGKAEIRFIRGRLHFVGTVSDRAPFNSIIAIWRPK